MSPPFLSVFEVLNGVFSLWNSPDIFSLEELSVSLFSLSFQDGRTRSAQEERKKKTWEELSVSLLYLFSLLFQDERTRSAQEIKHNVVNNTNPIIIIQKAKYTIKRKKKQKKTHKHKQIHNLSLKNILFQITKNPFKKK